MYLLDVKKKIAAKVAHLATLLPLPPTGYSRLPHGTGGREALKWNALLVLLVSYKASILFCFFFFNPNPSFFWINFFPGNNGVALVWYHY